MSTELNEAWTDEPPVLSTGERLATYSVFTGEMVKRAIINCGDDSNPIAIGCYIAVSRKIARPTIQQIEELLFDLTEEDFEETMSYITSVIDRRARAAVEVADEPGK